MHTSHTSERRIACWLGATLSALAISLVAGATSHAEVGDPNAYECSGSIAKGEAEPGSEGTPVRYKFSCNGPITGYQLESQIPLVGLQSLPLVANSKAEPPTESFSCGGEVPGYALDCVGSANAASDQISGQFFIGSKLCTEPREDPLLTVTYAYLEKEVVTQAISGPFDLGRPVLAAGETPSPGGHGSCQIPRLLNTREDTERKGRRARRSRSVEVYALCAR